MQLGTLFRSVAPSPAEPPGEYNWLTLTLGGFHVGIDVRTGELSSRGGEQVPHIERNGITASVYSLMARYGMAPSDPLELRDRLFG
ncbi:MAG: hypothetical protein MUF18_13525 [Fimbriiglobus sp.]|nr:hypothetical protein [Fimbriiglobus sp.]